MKTPTIDQPTPTEDTLMRGVWLLTASIAVTAMTMAAVVLWTASAGDAVPAIVAGFWAPAAALLVGSFLTRARSR